MAYRNGTRTICIIITHVTQQPGPEDDMDKVASFMDAEVRAEQAEYEAMALQAQWRSRSLADVARELMIRGDQIEVVTATRHLSGTMHNVGTDFCVMATPAGPVDVSLTTLTTLRVVRRVRAGGRPPGSGANTLRARMTEHQTSKTRLTVLLTDGDVVAGMVDAAASDHLLLRTATGHLFVPWPVVAAAWPPAE